MQNNQTIPQLLDDVRAGRLSRRGFARKLATIGISAAGVSAIVSGGLSASKPVPAPVTSQEDQNLQLHSQHLTHQMQGNLQALHHDYHEDAVVEDSLYGSLTGRAAIMAGKGAKWGSVSGASITVTNRLVQGSQVVVEWIANGVHVDDLPGIPASNRAYELRGVTVVVRNDEGKILRESIYYDANQLKQQLGAL